MDLRWALLLLTLGAGSGCSEDRIILTTHDQAPLTYLDNRDVVVGSAVRPLVYALGQMGWKYDIRIYPWTRAQELVRTGQADGFFAASRSPDRDRYSVASLALARQTTNWYLLRETTIDPRSPGFQAQARVAGYAGSNMLQWLKDRQFLVVGEPTDPDQLFFMLALGRFDACLANDNNFNNFLAKNRSFTGRFRAVERDSAPLVAYFSRKFLEAHPGFLEQFNRGLAAYPGEP